jgi:DNA-binding NtrC family response regulator
LRNCLERAAILCEGGLIAPEHLPVKLMSAQQVPAALSAAANATPAAEPAGDLPSVERVLIQKALETARFNKSKAAKALGLTRQQLYVRMRRYGLD